MSEALTRLQHLAAQFQARVDAVPADRWDATSPCEGWTARDVVAHVTDNLRRTAAGPKATPMGADEDPKVAFAQSLQGLLDAMAQPGALEREVPGPFGPMPVEQLIGRLICSDVLVHTWDLARAAGLDETLDADAVHRAYAGLKPMDANLRHPGVFGPKLEAPAGADEQTEFLMFLGRAV